MREDRGRFAALHDSRVLVYWPHGLGDFATLSVIAPLFEPSNAYAIARFGDDYTSLMDGDRIFKPLCSGVFKPTDGSFLGTRNLGLDIKRCDGREVELRCPHTLESEIAGFAPDSLLWTDYPETEGRTAYPLHTKARNLAGLLVKRERLSGFDLSQPLRSTLDFTAPAAAQAKLDAQLAAFAPPGTKLAILSRTGFTAARKNWGDESEARAFVETMRGDGWRFISMDDEPLGDNVAGFRALFADLDEPFALLYKALAARASLFVGVPAGPLHVTMVRLGIPTVGLWLAHHPDWYDEPNPDAIHLVGRLVRDKGFDKRPATVTKPPSLQHRLVYLDSLEISPGAVMEAVRAVGA
ncbi:MAG TPA: hypothetical protein VK760_00870 [Candidatus Acidoferrales bacterium]|jgi:hypothetical protein|nr:hypothetical protein [Candidatus Acidoferrales bacterium]